jgi:hypothetical protein
MRPWIALIACATAVAGCQTPPPETAAPGHRTVAVHPGDAAVSAVGTPFFLVFKGAFCAASLAIAAPVAAIAAMSESSYAPAARRDLGDGVAQNCGPPYVLSPYRVVSTEPVTAQSELSAPATGGPTELLGPN